MAPTAFYGEVSRLEKQAQKFEVGGYDGAYKGWIHVIVPFIRRKNGTLAARQQSYNDGMGGIGHALSNSLLTCGIGVWLRLSGVAALMSCTSPCVFCCISRNFAFGGKFVTLLMDHGTMSRLMFGQIKATRPLRKMRERMR